MRLGQPEAERRVRVWLCPVDGAGGGGRPPCVVRPFFSRTRRWSVTSNLLDHPPFASVTICRVAQCRHHQLEGPPGPALCLPSCWGPFRDPCRGSMWPLWPEPRFASSVEKCFKGKHLLLKWRNVLKENLTTCVLCSPWLRWPSPEGAAGTRTAVPPTSGRAFGVTEPSLRAFVGCRLAEACSAARGSQVLFPTGPSTDTGLCQCLGRCEQRCGQRRAACGFESGFSYSSHSRRGATAGSCGSSA